MYPRTNTRLSFSRAKARYPVRVRLAFNPYSLRQHARGAGKLGLGYTLCALRPELRSVSGLQDASRIVFGIKTLTVLVQYVEHSQAKRIAEFFGDDKSSLAAWAAVCPLHRWFLAVPEQRPVWKRMVRDLSLPVVATLASAADWQDCVRGYQFLRADTKRWTRFVRDVLSKLAMFPRGTHATMVHDYAMRAMQAQERKHRPKGAALAGRALTALPVALPSCLETAAGDTYTVTPATCEAQLRAIGRAQGHCVGTKQMGYAEKAARGEIYIISLHRQSLADGLCLEVSARTGRVVQAQGKHRRAPTSAEQVLIETIETALRAA